tara:strand:+ start:84 stop:539 length:456 start_codon:yes stop_codon:yes gene_type:complete
MKTKFFIITVFFICFTASSQTKVKTEYIGDGLYKFSTEVKIGEDFFGNKSKEAIINAVQNFEMKNNVKQKYIKGNRLEIKDGATTTGYLWEGFHKFYKNENNLLFISNDEKCAVNDEIIKRIKNFIKLKDEDIIDKTRYFELINELINSLQ